MRLASMMLLVALLFASLVDAAPVRVTGKIIDAESGKTLAARLYIRGEQGKAHFAHSSLPDGRAFRYDKARSPQSVEQHTTLSADPFIVDLEPGKYRFTVERGKEYLSHTRDVVVGSEPISVTIPIKRWLNLAEQGWYSGETHVHRTLDELPTVMLAEDLNVALPLTYWGTRSHTPPTQGDKNSAVTVKAEPDYIDPTHVIYPLNTEYEIFSVKGKTHTLGAIFALGHKTVFTRGVPPVGPIARQVRSEGGLLELDKHNWPWSMMLVPVMNVDLYELTNNHIWRAPFHFRGFGTPPPPAWMEVETDGKGMTERGWIEYTWNNYYALLNCGFRMRPTAGTASGVHPVPLGYGRVYVHTDGPFSYESWMQGLDAGRTFVTTGPMLLATLDDQHPGHTFGHDGQSKTLRLRGTALSERPLTTIEVVVAGRVVQTLVPENKTRTAGGFESKFDLTVKTTDTSWVALRCRQKTDDGRFRFAHTAPWHVIASDRPIRPRRGEAEFFVEQMQTQIARNRSVLTPGELAEFESALATYEKIAESAN